MTDLDPATLDAAAAICETARAAGGRAIAANLRAAARDLRAAQPDPEPTTERPTMSESLNPDRRTGPERGKRA